MDGLTDLTPSHAVIYLGSLPDCVLELDADGVEYCTEHQHLLASLEFAVPDTPDVVEESPEVNATAEEHRANVARERAEFIKSLADSDDATVKDTHA